MPAPRQQRANNARGDVPWRTIGASAPLAWTLDSWTPTDTLLRITDAPAGMSLNGIPQAVRSDTGETPLNATLTGEVLDLNWATVLPLGVTVTIPPKDPALRGPQGQYLESGIIIGPAAQPPIPVVYRTNTTTVEQFSINVYTDALGSLNVPTASETPSWFTVITLPSLTTDLVLPPSCNPQTIPSSESWQYTWDGTLWQGVKVSP